MLDLSPANAAAYLGYACSATSLGGGVSNTVLLIDAGPRRFVLKQSLGKLKVEQDWFSDRTRIFREAAAIRLADAMLPAGSVPSILFEDPDNFIYAMSAAPSNARPWKELLLDGEVDVATAEAVARILGNIIQKSWMSAELEAQFGDQTAFDELRLDPYYRSTAARHPDLASFFQNLIEKSGRRRYALVHGDWSPKNFLVSERTVMAIDFEVIHFGDPSFDAAFLLNHLLLKSFYRPQWRDRYSEAALRFFDVLMEYVPKPNDWFEPATMEHLGALLLARIDGKSPAEYIQDPGLQSRIRDFARSLIVKPPANLRAIF